MSDQHTIQMIADNMTATSNKNRNLITRLDRLEEELKEMKKRLERVENACN